jgi:hypothetical protein
MFKIHPYRNHNNLWVFDDPERGIYNEPLVDGADILAAILADGRDSFTLLFSDRDENPGLRPLILSQTKGHDSYYWNPTHSIFVYLCPALYAYFPAPPQVIYYQAEHP